MTTMLKVAIGVVATGGLVGCVETTGSGSTPSGVVAPPDMVDECIRQIRVGQPDARITTRPAITAGPDNRVFVGMSVDDARYGCRIEDDGSYTAFPQFAN